MGLLAAVAAASIAVPSARPEGSGPAFAQPAAVGETTMVVRSVYGTLDAERRQLAVADDVFWQELIETGMESAAKMVFVDGTTLTTGPESRVRIDDFVVSGDSRERRVVISLARGILRFITGSLPSDSYEIRTPSAMIGVRGTEFSVAVDEQGETRVNVLRGSVFLTALSGYATEVRPGQSSRTRADRSSPPAAPTKPDAAVVVADTKVAALLAVAASGNPAEAASESDVQQLRARQRQAVETRVRLGTSQTGPSCTGC